MSILFFLRDKGVERVENASIPAFGDVAGVLEGAAPRPAEWGETASGSSGTMRQIKAYDTTGRS
jgi:hypothetical protein